MPIFLQRAVLVAALFFSSAWAQSPADVVFLDAHIWTADSARSWATGLGIKDKKIVYVGTDAGALALVGPSTKVLHLQGKMVLPGFCDSHTHPVISGVEMGLISLGDAPDRPAIEARIRTYAQQHPDLLWVVGGGWNTPAWPGDPTAKDLDALIPDRPAFFTTSDAHTAWVNSLALEIAGVDKSTPDPPSGRIERDQNGNPSGLLRESAIGLVATHLPPESPESYRNGALFGLRMANSFGITSVEEANANDEILGAYRALERDHLLTVRVVAALETDADAGPAQVERLKAKRAQWTSPMVRVLAAKIFADGVMESRTAALLEPYTGYPSDRGILNWSPDVLKSTVIAVDAAGFQIHAHSIGDRATREMLDAIEAAQKANGKRDGRHHLAHLQLVDPTDLPRFRRLGMLANIQPLWAFRDAFIKDLTEPILGPDRSARMYPLASLQRSGAVLVAGSDWSVSSMSPLQGMEVALTRLDPDGSEEEPWIPDQRLDLPSILAAYTINGAYLSFQEKLTGSVEVGKWADLVVLERDLFEIPASEIGEVRVLLTLLAGKVVYQAESFPF